MILLALGSGFLFGLLGLWVFDRIPKRWLLDYGETEEEGLKSRFETPRIRFWPYGIAGAFLLAAGWAGLYYFHGNDKGYFFSGLAILWLLMQIAMADGKYGILPDQLILSLVGMAGILVAQNIRYGGLSWEVLREPLLGALVCGGSFLGLSWLTAKVAGQETIGMGDCKLLGALGLLLGPVSGIQVMIWALLICGLILGIMVSLERLKLTAHAPFAPYLALSFSFWLIFQ